MLKQNAVVSLKAKGHWIEFTETSAWPFWGHCADAMTREDCKASENPAQFKDDDDREVACEILNDPKLPSAVHKAVRSQRGVGLMLIFYGVFLGTPVYRWALRARSVRAVRDEISRKTIEGP